MNQVSNPFRSICRVCMKSTPFKPIWEAKPALVDEDPNFQKVPLSLCLECRIKFDLFDLLQPYEDYEVKDVR